jgi:hypothetical protein
VVDRRWGRHATQHYGWARADQLVNRAYCTETCLSLQTIDWIALDGALQRHARQADATNQEATTTVERTVIVHLAQMLRDQLWNSEEAKGSLSKRLQDSESRCCDAAASLHRLHSAVSVGQLPFVPPGAPHVNCLHALNALHVFTLRSSAILMLALAGDYSMARQFA